MNDLISDNDGISATVLEGPLAQSHCAAISKSIDDQVNWKTSWDRKYLLKVLPNFLCQQIWTFYFTTVASETTRYSHMSD